MTYFGRAFDTKSHYNGVHGWEKKVRMPSGPPTKWFASLPKEEWNFETKEDYDNFIKNWDNDFGDRNQEIVLIGKEMDKKKIYNNLDECLLTQDEISKGINYWKKNGDNFGEE